ncbi:MAG TPA: amidase [Myxococcota bacterium]|nr:amidase [Myxococcota bacterium]
MDPVAFRSASVLAAALRRREIGSVELLDLTLARVARWNPALNAIVALDLEAARARARAADEATARGETWGLLHGLPITIKDSIEVAGMPCTSGAPALARHVPAATAPAAQRLIDAGAVVFGKTNLPLYAGDFQSYNDVHGTTNNPWDPTRVPGGSSGGSAAALAAGLCGLELGSDIGGSIRNPSHFCGVYGHKPSYGLVPARGHIPGPPGARAEADLAVLGPMARSAKDLALALDLLAGPDEPAARAWRVALPAARRGRLADYRVALWLDDPRCPVDAEVGDALQGAVDALARAGVPIHGELRPVDAGESRACYLQLLYGVFAPGFPPALLAAFDAQAPQLDPGDDTLPAHMIRGAAQRHREWQAVNERRHGLRARWEAFFRDFDVLLAPVMPTVAFPHDHSDIAARTIEVNGKPFPYLEQIYWAGLATVAGLPATAVPIGLGRSGLPVGLQVIGPFLEDRTPLDFAARMAEVVGGFVAPPGYA